jgi:predicted regulator of Ras-like GTPase activity (Roadblock/LC7/MglB family)
MSASSNSVKPGFFGILKGLFRRSDDSSNSDNHESSFGADAPLAPPPVEVASAPAASAAINASYRGNGNNTTSGIAGISIPLQSILNGLPVELRPKVRVQAVGDLTVTITLDKILSQLAHGLVHVPFGEIRQAAPHVFAPGIESDRIPVALPLNEVLSRINPALLMRRSTQRQVEVPSNITSPFATPGQGLSVSVGNIKPVQPAAPRRAAPASTMPERGSISFVKPPMPPSGDSTQPASIPFSFAKQVIPTPAAKTTPPSPSPRREATPLAKAAPVAAPVAASQQAVLAVPLSALSESWAEGIRQEIVQQKLADVRVALPVDAVELALKRGRVVFTWKALRSWIRPATPPMVSAHDAIELELPLKVIAPLFISRQQGATQHRQKLAVDEEIPNLFFGFPQPEAPAATAPIPMPAALAPPAPVAMPPAAPVAASPAAPVTPKPVETNYYIWDDASDTTQLHIDAIRRTGASGTEFVKRYASPNEIVSRAAALDGVAGALIALPDGLMVASRIPTELNADTLAAFLPQLFNKVSQCTKELRMGELNNLNFTVGNVPWKIFRVNAIFFAVFGRAAQSLPTTQLVGLAAELDRKNK